MKYVTYQTTRSDQQRRLPRRRRDRRRRLRRRHGRLHRGRRSPRYDACGGDARHDATPGAPAPAHDPRLPRLRGAPEERLRRTRQGDPRRVVPRPRLLQGAARHRDRPGRRDPLAVVHREARPRARARRRHRTHRQGHHRGQRAGPRLRLHDLERHVGPRRPDPRAARRHGPLQGQGLGRLQRPRALHRHRRRDRPARRRPRGPDQRRALGRRQHQGHAPHLRVDDRLRLAGRSPCAPARSSAPAPPPAARASSSTAGSSPATRSRWRPAASASSRTGSARSRPDRTTTSQHVPPTKEKKTWHS